MRWRRQWSAFRTRLEQGLVGSPAAEQGHGFTLGQGAVTIVNDSTRFNLSNRRQRLLLVRRPLGEPDSGLPRQHAGFNRGAAHPNHALGQGNRFGAEVADAVPATWAYEMQHIGIVDRYPFQLLDRL